MQSAVTIQAAEAEGGPPRFEVLAYTGGPLTVAGYDQPVIVDLAGLEFGNSIVANLDHDRTKRVGHVTERLVEAGQLRFGGIASAATAARDEVVNSAAAGFVWQASIEAMPAQLKSVAAGKTVEVNGKPHTGPVYIAAKSKLRGFAFVSNGADDNTTVTIAAEADSNKRGSEMKAELKAWIEGLGLEIDALSNDQVANLTADFEGRQGTRPKPKTKEIRDVIEAQRVRNEKLEQITALCTDAMRENPWAVDTIERLAETAIEADWPLEKFELQLLRDVRPQGHTVRGRRDGQLSNRVLEAAVCMAGGLGSLEAAYDEKTLEAARQRFPNGVGLQELLLIGAQENGLRTTSTQVTLEVQRAAFGLAPGGRQIEAGFSTLSIPNILSNTANKFLLEGWNAVDSTWRGVSSRRSVRDFKQVTSYSLNGGFEYEKVGPGGELKHGTVGETQYTNQAETYGKMFAITRTDIINDDLGALTAVPRRLGRGAAMKLNDVFWTEFLNNSDFFKSGNSNVSTGTGSALAAAGLAAAEVVFMNQTDPDGYPLGTMPAVLLVPPTLYHTALALMESTAVVGSTSQPNANIWQGRFRTFTSSYMENSNYTGNSTAAWYLLADPMDLSTIEVCFLNGRESPVVETADADFNVLGVQMRGYHDFGVNLQEYRAGVRSAGS